MAENCNRKESVKQLDLTEEAVKRVEMKMDICDGPQRVWTLHRDYLWNLRMAGLQDISFSKPHKALRHILFWIKPSYLKTRMKNTLLWRKHKNFDQRDLDSFMRELTEKAENLQIEMRLRSYGDADRSLRGERNHRHPYLWKRRNVVTPSKVDGKENKDMRTRTAQFHQGVKKAGRKMASMSEWWLKGERRTPIH